MNAEPNQNFEKLQQALKLKRYEVPPPRYFNSFSSQVTGRLRAGEIGRLDTFEEAVSQTPWLRAIWKFIEGRPAVSGMFATGVCGLILAGSFLSGKMPVPAGLALDTGHQPGPAAPGEGSAFATASGAGGALTFSSTNPSAVLPGNSLFNLSPQLQTAPVSARPVTP